MTAPHHPGKIAPLLLVGLFLAGSLASSRAESVGSRGRRLTRSSGVPAQGGRHETTPAELASALDKLPLYFVENRGQLDARAAYYVPGHKTSLYFTSEGVTFSLCSRQEHDEAESQTSPAPRYALKLDFVGADRKVKPTGQARTPAVVSYFKGPRAQWKTGLKTYGEVLYPNLWPGIDLAYSGTASQLKYEFRVRPGADPEQIRLAYRGAADLRINAAGELEVATPDGGFKDAKPYSYQERDGKRVEVPSAYTLSENSHQYGFKVERYDRSRPLVIDPAVFVYATYLGGTARDGGSDIAVDSAGNTYVVGITFSSEASFPVAVGPDLSFNDAPGVPRGDAFIAKLNAAGTALIYAGYIGGDALDSAGGVAVDSLGNAYVSGFTRSPETSFPVAVGPDLTFNDPAGVLFGGDAFIARVNAAGTGLDYAGYIGGANRDLGDTVAVDGEGNAYVTGSTNSTEATFPVTVGPDLTFNGGLGGDAFVAKVKADGSGLVYAGYIGGADSDTGNGIAVDDSGSAYVVGGTNSTEATFPDGDGFGAVPGVDQTHNGNSDGFVVKVNSAGTGLDYAGYIGGAASDTAFDVAIDNLGNAYVVGEAESTEATFPDGDGFGAVPGVDQTHNGDFDAFVAKVNAAGTALIYAGYIGGSGLEEGFGIALDGLGDAYVTGFTESTQATFPVREGPDLTFNGDADGFVAKVDAAGTALIYAGYIGGVGSDSAESVAVDGQGNAYVTGATRSNQATFPDGDGFGNLPGFDRTFNDAPGLMFGGDSFVVKVREVQTVSGGILSVPSQLNFSARIGRSVSKKLVIRNRSRTESLEVTVGALSDPFEVVSGGGAFVIPPNGHHTVVIRFTPEGRRTKGTLEIASSDPNRPLVRIKLSGIGRRRR